MKTYLIANMVAIYADDCIRGVFINPMLPESFDNTENDTRPFEHMIWWMRPFIVGSVGDWGVRCLDGGAWDRSTHLGQYTELDDAVEAAHAHTLRQPYIMEMCKSPNTGTKMCVPVEWWQEDANEKGG